MPRENICRNISSVKVDIRERYPCWQKHCPQRPQFSTKNVWLILTVSPWLSTRGAPSPSLSTMSKMGKTLTVQDLGEDGSMKGAGDVGMSHQCNTVWFFCRHKPRAFICLPSQGCSCAKWNSSKQAACRQAVLVSLVITSIPPPVGGLIVFSLPNSSIISEKFGRHTAMESWWSLTRINTAIPCNRNAVAFL